MAQKKAPIITQFRNTTSGHTRPFFANWGSREKRKTGEETPKILEIPASVKVQFRQVPKRTACLFTPLISRNLRRQLVLRLRLNQIIPERCTRIDRRKPELSGP